MDKRLPTLAERLADAKKKVDVSASDLARACGVSPAAVSKWLDGRTKELKAQNYVDAAKALRVREEWLRAGKLPRELGAAAESEHQVDRVYDLLEELKGPLGALAKAIDQLSEVRPSIKRKAG